jgi:hypothetical protein
MGLFERLKVVTPSVKENDSGVKSPDPKSPLGLIRFGGNGAASVKEPVTLQVGGHVVPVLLPAKTGHLS